MSRAAQGNFDRCALFYDFTAFRKRGYVDDRAIHPRRAQHAAAA
jgi:hypothetical protein